MVAALRLTRYLRLPRASPGSAGADGAQLAAAGGVLALLARVADAPGARRAEMEALLARPQKDEDEWEQIVAFVKEYEGVKAAAETAREYAAHAQECLGVLVPSPAREALELAVRLVVARNN